MQSQPSVNGELRRQGERASSAETRTATDRRPVTIGVFGHYGNENLGDEAIIEAVIQSVRTRYPHARIYGFSINPADTAKRYGIPAFPIRHLAETRSVPPVPGAGNTVDGGRTVEAPRSRFDVAKALAKRVPLVRRAFQVVRWLASAPGRLWRESCFLCQSRARMRELDLLLVSGSNQFLDNFGGVWGFPYTLLKWSILAKLTGTRLAFLSIGAGPIKSPVSRVFVRLALRLAGYASFRDAASKQLIEGGRRRDFGAVYPDLAHGLVLQAPSASRAAGREPPKRPTVGINPMPVYDRRYWHDPDDSQYRHYVERLAMFASMLLRDDYGVFFFPTQARDEHVIEDILEALDPDLRRSIDSKTLVRAGKTVATLMDVYASADLIVATRFHGVLLALRAGLPVLGICYFRKTRDLLREVGQENCAVELETFTALDLYARLQALERDVPNTRARIRERGEEYRAALRSQYDCVFALIEGVANESA